MAHRVFISLTGSDAGIANAIKEALDKLFGDLIETEFSPSKEIGVGIGGGKDWLGWIEDIVANCEFALVLVTPTSVQTPWILWESGAVYGAAISGKSISRDKVRPLIYQISPDQVPSPILQSKVQIKRGDDPEDFEGLMYEIFDLYKDELSESRHKRFVKNLSRAIKTYEQKIDELLLTAAVPPSSYVIDEWRSRLEKLLVDERLSEVEQLHDWMNVAYGRADAETRPLDLGIHTQLGEIYFSIRKHKKAAEQFELARKIVPRDIYILLNLGRAYLECGEREKTDEILKRIEALDETAFERNAECAALLGRWHREGDDWKSAGDTYRKALQHNPDSYYLANVAGEAYLKAGSKEEADDSFREALGIIEKIDEDNVWTSATAANATFALGDDENTMKYLRKVREHRPTPSDFATIETGLRRISESVDPNQDRVKALISGLR